MQDGRERLRTWIFRSRLQNQQVAEQIGLNPAHLSQILHGHRRPGLKVALRIERVTGIPASAWAPSDDDDSDRRARKDVDLSPVGRR